MYDYRLDFPMQSLSTLEERNRADRPFKRRCFLRDFAGSNQQQQIHRTFQSLHSDIMPNTKVILVKYVAWKKDSLQCRRYQGKLKTNYSHCHGARKFPHLTTKFDDMVWSGKIVCSKNCLVAWKNLSKLKRSMIFACKGSLIWLT